jgi:hypothetical protein
MAKFKAAYRLIIKVKAAYRLIVNGHEASSGTNHGPGRRDSCLGPARRDKPHAVISAVTSAVTIAVTSAVISAVISALISRDQPHASRTSA